MPSHPNNFMSEDSSGSLTISTRFQRIEDSLNRIEDKLDTKATGVELTRMDARVVALENGTSPYSKQLIEQFFQAQRDLATIKMEGSTAVKAAQTALLEADLLAKRMTALEMATGTQAAVVSAVSTSQQNSRKLTILLITMVINALGMFAALATALWKLH